MNKINLYYLADPKTGGWVTYILELIKSLKMVGTECTLIKIGTRTTTKTFHDDVSIHTMPIEMACLLNKKTKSIIVAMELKDEAMADAAKLIRNGSSIVHHGSGQTPKKEWFDSIGKTDFLNICVREQITSLVSSFGYKSHYLMHPYNCKNKKVPVKSKNAVSISRLDFVKKIEIICGANEKVGLVDIFGSENRLYTHLSLDKKFPNWRKDYKGEFTPLTGHTIALPYKFLVDLTQIKNDGGGTQYTFLEAIDSGCALILNKKWVANGGDFTEGVNCLAADSPDGLVQALKSKTHKQLHEGTLGLLKRHEGAKIARQLLDII